MTTTPAWLLDLAKAAGPAVVGELIRVGADYIMNGHPVASAVSLGDARKVRDLLPDPLPNDALDDKIDAEIERRQAEFKGIFGGALDAEADTEPPTDGG